MKYYLNITTYRRGDIYYFTGKTSKDITVFSAYLFHFDKFPQFRRDEYFKNWKCLRYYMKIQLLKIKMAEINK